MRVLATATTGVLATLLAAGCAQTDENADEPAAQTHEESAHVDRVDPALDELIAPDASVERVATGFSFTEGPLWHDGKLWFSDVTGNKLRTVDTDGNVTEILDNSGGIDDAPEGSNIGSNGLTVDAEGRVVMTQMGARRIVNVDETGAVTPIVSEYDGKRLNSPNDVAYAPDGALWFTDPPFGLFNGMNEDPAKELEYNAVFRYTDGELTPAITDLALPNGLAFSPDGSELYVADYDNGTIYAWTVGEGGALSGRRVVTTLSDEDEEGGVDGIKVDKLGNIWSTGPGGVWIIAPEDGKLLGRIHMPEVTANLGFAEDGNAVWMTASTSVYRLPIKGVGALPRYAGQ